MALPSSTVADATRSQFTRSGFRNLLRNSKIARYQPQLEQVYTSHGGFKHRGDYGVKRPLPRSANKYVRIKGIDYPPQSHTNFRTASKEAHFVKRFDESGWSLAATEFKDSAADGLGWRHISWFDSDAEKYLRLDRGFVNELPLIAPDVEEGSPESPAPSLQPPKRTDPQQRSYMQMTDKQFEEYLEELKSVRPQFQTFLAQRNQDKERKRELFIQRRRDTSIANESGVVDPSESSADEETAKADDQETSDAALDALSSTDASALPPVDLFDESQQHIRSEPNKTPNAFISLMNSQAIQEARDAYQGKHTGRYLPSHRVGGLGLSYVRDNPIWTTLQAPRIPGRVLTSARTTSSNTDMNPSAALNPQIGVRASVIGNIAQIRNANLQTVSFYPESTTDRFDKTAGHYKFTLQEPVDTDMSAVHAVDQQVVTTDYYTPDAARSAHDTDSMQNEPKWLNARILNAHRQDVWDAAKEARRNLWRPKLGSQEYVSRNRPESRGRATASPLNSGGFASGQNSSQGWRPSFLR